MESSPHVLFVALYNGESFASPLWRVVNHLNASGAGQPSIYFHALVNHAYASVEPWCTQHELAKMPLDAQAQHRNLTRGKPKGAHIFLWKAFLYRLVSVPKLIVLDLDVVLVAGARLHDLWAEFHSFGPRAVLGLVPEQGPTYARRGLAKNQSAFNGGVQLHHLRRMRGDPMASSFHESLTHCAAGGCVGWDRVEPSLGDQTLYTDLCNREPHLCQVVSCGWNRQMSTKFYSVPGFATGWHACSSRCRLLHFNQPLLETLAPLLQQSKGHPSCTVCRSALVDLENRTRASGSHNPKFTWGASKQHMARLIGDCCCPPKTTDDI